MAWSVGDHLALFYIHQMNQLNSCSNLGHDVSAINIFVVIIIIIKSRWLEHYWRQVALDAIFKDRVVSLTYVCLERCSLVSFSAQLNIFYYLLTSLCSVHNPSLISSDLHEEQNVLDTCISLLLPSVESLETKMHFWFVAPPIGFSNVCDARKVSKVQHVLLLMRVTFQATSYHRLLTGTKLYCSVTKVRVLTTCAALHSTTGEAGIQTHNLLITSPPS